MQDLSKNTCVTDDTSTEVDWLCLFDTKISQSPNDEEGDTSNEDGNAGVVPNPSEGITEVRRYSRPKSKPVRFNDFVVNSNVRYGLEKFVCYSNLSSVNYCFSTVLNKFVEPGSYMKACNDDNWINVINLEMEALHRNNTWVLVDLPVGRKAIREGINYEETFSPVVKMVTVRCLIGLAISKNWSLFQLDVNNAFFYGDLDEEVYMALPPSALLENGFIQSKNDYSLYVKSKKGLFIALLVYVDDILKYFLGIEVLENKNGVCLSQMKYYLELLCEYGLLACKPAATPLQQNNVLSFDETEKDKFLPSMTEYQKLVGKLIYLSVTRPDIAYDVHCLSQHIHAPLQSHFSAGLKVLRYLKQALRTGIQFDKGNMFRLHAFSDADWAKCLKTRKSVSGFCVHFCNNLVSWKSKTQATISRFGFFLQMGFTLILATLDGLDVGLLGDVIGGGDCDDDE
ncbi:ribonuclease H-like domain-containing protein [Tanacetum coccineum]